MLYTLYYYLSVYVVCEFMLQTGVYCIGELSCTTLGYILVHGLIGMCCILVCVVYLHMPDISMYCLLVYVVYWIMMYRGLCCA